MAQREGAPEGQERTGSINSNGVVLHSMGRVAHAVLRDDLPTDESGRDVLRTYCKPKLVSYLRDLVYEEEFLEHWAQFAKLLTSKYPNHFDAFAIGYASAKMEQT